MHGDFFVCCLQRQRNGLLNCGQKSANIVTNALHLWTMMHSHTIQNRAFTVLEIRINLMNQFIEAKNIRTNVINTDIIFTVLCIRI